MRRRLLRLLKLLGLKRNDDGPDGRAGQMLHWSRVVVMVLLSLVTMQSVLLVAGAWRNDRQIERNMGVAAAEVLDAGPRRSTIEFVTPDRITYRPELGVLYPSELETGMRIYVEYDKNNPDLVRVQNRNAALAIIPAGSIAVIGWLIGTVALVALALIEKRLTPNEPAPRQESEIKTEAALPTAP